LRQVRTALGLTQQQMFERLGETQTALYPGHIGLYESGQREPPLPVLLRYARIAGVYVDALIDDEIDLPDYLPAVTGAGGVMPRKRAKSGKAKGR
jgi:transcriptional regulator with XRE-family HTH domain